MKISGQHKGKFSILWVKGKSPNIFLDYVIYQIKTGTKCKLTGFLQVPL